MELCGGCVKVGLLGPLWAPRIHPCSRGNHKYIRVGQCGIRHMLSPCSIVPLGRGRGGGSLGLHVRGGVSFLHLVKRGGLHQVNVKIVFQKETCSASTETQLQTFDKKSDGISCTTFETTEITLCMYQLCKISNNYLYFFGHMSTPLNLQYNVSSNMIYTYA